MGHEKNTADTASSKKINKEFRLTVDVSVREKGERERNALNDHAVVFFLLCMQPSVQRPSRVTSLLEHNGNTITNEQYGISLIIQLNPQHASKLILNSSQPSAEII